MLRKLLSKEDAKSPSSISRKITELSESTQTSGSEAPVRSRVSSLGWLVGLSSGGGAISKQEVIHKDAPCVSSTRIFSNGSLLEKGFSKSRDCDNNSYREKRTGLRKLAKNLLFNSEMDCPEPTGTETLNDQDGGTKRHRSSRTAGKRSGRHFLSDWFSEDKKCSSKGEDEFAVKEKLLLSKLIEANLNNTGVSGNSGNSELQKNAIPVFGQLKVRHSNPLQDNGMEMNRMEVTTQMLEDNTGLINSRTLLLTDIPPYTSLPAILSRIGGGPLQRIDLLKRHNWEALSEPHSWNQPIDWQQSVLKLQFDSHENAIIFYEHSRTNAFIVNGCHLLTLWMPDKCTPDPEKTGQDEIDKEILNLMAEPENARRVLVLKQPVPNKKRTAGRKHFSYPDPLANYSSDFDIEEVVGDFSRFGKIVEVTPVISRKLCFGIQFFDIVSAMDAKHNIEGDVEDQDELKLEIARKYGGWYVWYGKDPTDKPILA